MTNPPTGARAAPRPDFPAFFDSSMLSAALSCDRLFEYSYLRHLQPKAQSIHLVAGAAFASGIEAIRNAFWLHGMSFRSSYAAGFRAAVAAWGTYDPPFQTNKSLPRVLEALYLYTTEWWPLPLDTLKPYERPGGAPSVEWSFSVEIPGVTHPVSGDPIFYVGRTDMIGEFNSQLFVVDEKTTSQMGASWTKNWDLRGQFTGYCWAVRETRGLPVVGAIVRGVAFRAHDYGHAEVMTLRSPWMIDQWLERTIYTIEHLKEAWVAGRWIPNHDSACTQYGGCRFYDLCTKHDPEPWIDMDFEVRPWDPLHRAGEST